MWECSAAHMALLLTALLVDALCECGRLPLTLRLSAGGLLLLAGRLLSALLNQLPLKLGSVVHTLCSLLCQALLVSKLLLVRELTLL